MKQEIFTPNAPEPTGPNSQAIIFNNLVFISGQLPIDTNNEIVASDISSQTKQVMKNIREILDKAGSSFEKIIKTTVYLKNIRDLKFLDDIYSTYFDDTPPARTVIEISHLEKDVLIQVDCIATI